MDEAINNQATAATVTARGLSHPVEVRIFLFLIQFNYEQFAERESGT